MRLKCSKQLDALTPHEVIDDGFKVAFTLDNYGERWVFIAPASSES